MAAAPNDDSAPLGRLTGPEYLTSGTSRPHSYTLLLLLFWEHVCENPEFKCRLMYRFPRKSQKKKKVPLWLFVSESSKPSIIFCVYLFTVVCPPVTWKGSRLWFWFFCSTCVYVPSHGCFDNGCVLSSSERESGERRFLITVLHLG